MNEHSDCSEPPDDDGIAADYATVSVSTNYQVAVAVDFYELKRAKGRVSSLEWNQTRRASSLPSLL